MIRATMSDAYDLLHRGTLALAQVEWNGLRVDTEYCAKETEKLSKEIARLQDEFNKSTLGMRWKERYGEKYNTSSSPQLSYMLYKDLKLDPAKTTRKGNGSTDEEALESLDLPELRLLIKERKLAKIQGTYLDSFVRETTDDFLHPFYNLHTAVTYRSSSQSPNFQNIPVRDPEAMRICRGAVFARKGHQLLEADFSSLEVMIAACYHKDPTMLSYLRDPKSDMHGDVSKQLFVLKEFDKSKPADKELRFATKNGFVFAEFYGSYWRDCAAGVARIVKLPQDRKWTGKEGIMTPLGVPLSQHLRDNGIPSYRAFENHVKEIEKDFWERRFPVYAKWREEWYSRYLVRGYFDTLTGFRCQGSMRRNEVINYPVQGSAFHCLLWTLIRVQEIAAEEGWDSREVGQIHDSLLIDTHPEEAQHVVETIRRVVRTELPAAWSWIIVPLDIEIEATEVDRPWSHKTLHY